MKDPNSFYKNQLEKYQGKVDTLGKSLNILSVLRLSVFVFAGIGLYFFFNLSVIVLLIVVFGIVLFLLLLSEYTNVKAKYNLYKRLVQLNEDELNIAAGDFHNRADGSEFQNPKHYYSLDIDLFGVGSLFQFINRTTIKEGAEKLAQNLLANDITAIKRRQKAIKELANLPKWRQHYAAVSQGVKVEYPAKAIINWLQNYKPFLSQLNYWLAIGFSIISIVVLGLCFTQIIPFSFAVYGLLLGLAITGRYVKRVNRLAQHTAKVKDTFRQYALLLKEIETTTFTSKLLKQQQQNIQSKTLKASEIFLKFSKALDALDNRNNVFIAILGNGYLLWDIRQAYKIEQWIIEYANIVEDWFEVVTFFDAFNTLGNYAFNHQEFVYPEITDESTTISARDLGHPLIATEKRINSDLELQKAQFFIITGANMAGKSTFLRTVGLHIVMANVGLPVCAKQSRYQPIQLITSMRTTDSLTDDSSYFFSELTRLKFIVDTIEKDSNYFIILDEILKGTNSTDKAIGSKKFVERLVKLKATGIIATHDLSLTDTEQELEAVKNYYFDAQIVNDELYFDYKLKKGICQNMNASFLLKKMKIVT